ncbi:MAG TPA: pyridoxamine 5'-phosphate oxidase family protein [Acidimicrobiales bacterium]|nr:pyridoxamine 5'-phosphate oxidase family protein [Acidimicrobiales bacterium]
MRQGDLALLQTDAAERLLQSTIPARLAYSWHDGTPRVVPIWFHWDGADLVVASVASAPKVKAIESNPDVALTIDDSTFPHDVLLVRGRATVTKSTGVVPEYAAAAKRYFGDEQGEAWVAQLPADGVMARVAVRPTWAGLLDFKTRFPSALGGVQD